jgi:hypothetical protein
MTEKRRLIFVEAKTVPDEFLPTPWKLMPLFWDKAINETNKKRIVNNFFIS